MREQKANLELIIDGNARADTIGLIVAYQFMAERLTNTMVAEQIQRLARCTTQMIDFELRYSQLYYKQYLENKYGRSN